MSNNPNRAPEAPFHIAPRSFIYIIGDVMKKRSDSENIIEYVTYPHLEIIGNSECLVEGIKGITEYTKEKIKLNLGKYSVTFFGDELSINSFSYEGMTVEGTIISLEYESNA